jgi:ATP-dependent DNA ligase
VDRIYLAIIASALLLLHGEAVLVGVDGGPDFDGLHSRKHNEEVQFYAFDILVADGEDIRTPLSMRKTNLSRPFVRRVDGIFLSDFEQGEIGPTFSGMPACSVWKAWFPNTGTGRTAPAALRIG